MNFPIRYLLTFLLVCGIVSAHAQTIATIAGNGITQYIGDGAPATTLSLAAPKNMFIDKKGNIFIADFYNNRIRKLAHDTLSTVAGTGIPGYSGDGGQATAAKLENPNGIFLDTAGNWYITEMHNDVVRKVDIHTGIISTVCGSGTGGYGGDGGSAIATAAHVEIPGNAVVDVAGNIYIPDYGNHRIRKVTAATGIISTIAGTGTPGYAGDNGPATAAKLNYPNGMCIDMVGNLYFTERANHTVRKIDLTGKITTVAGKGTQGYTGDNGLAVNAELNEPNAVFVDRQNYLYISDYTNNVIRAADPGGVIKTIAGTGAAGYTGDGGPAIACTFRGPTAVFVNDSGYIFIADGDNSVLRKMTPYAPFPYGVKQVTAPSVQIFPNPSSGRFTIAVPDIVGEGTIEIFNTIGQSVFSSQLTKTPIDVDLSSYPRGMYYVQFSTFEAKTMQKMIIR